MFFSDKITLRAVVTTYDAGGRPVPSNTDTVVWANVKSVVRSEFYAANANGINATMAFEVHAEDWDNQSQVVYSTKVYDVIRAYQKGLGIVELTCSDASVS